MNYIAKTSKIYTKNIVIIKGFSLVEMLFVLLIISILSITSYPVYQNLIAKIRRNDGKSALLNLANYMENYYLIHGTYKNATIGQGIETDIAITDLSPLKWYQISLHNLTDTTFLLKAHALTAQYQHDKSCRVLTFNNYGIKNAENQASDCW